MTCCLCGNVRNAWCVLVVYTMKHPVFIYDAVTVSRWCIRSLCVWWIPYFTAFSHVIFLICLTIRFSPLIRLQGRARWMLTISDDEFRRYSVSRCSHCYRLIYANSNSVCFRKCCIVVIRPSVQAFDLVLCMAFTLQRGVVSQLCVWVCVCLHYHEYAISRW